MKRNKNYFRYDLLALADDASDKVLIFTGIYKHQENSQWVTLSALRVYTEQKSKTICGHVNLNRVQVDSTLHLGENQHNKTIYFCGKISAYEHYGDVRGRVELAQLSREKAPIWISKSSDAENKKQADQSLGSGLT
jgi:hypothetical protein